MQKGLQIGVGLAATVACSVAMAQAQAGAVAGSSQPAVAATEMAPDAPTPAAQSPGTETAPAEVSPVAQAPITAQSVAASHPHEPSAPPASVGTASKPAPKDEGPATLLNKGLKVSGYGGVSVFGSRTAGQNVVYVGGEAAVLLDHRFAMGIAGYGLLSHVTGPNEYLGEPQRLSFGYGGFLLRYSFLSQYPYYVTVGTLVGAGGVAYTPEWTGDWSGHRHIDADPLFVVEPSIGAHLNMTRWMRFGVQVSYRLVAGASEASGVERPSDRDLSGFAYGGHLQFGWL